jgi:hypothetical protein
MNISFYSVVLSVIQGIALITDVVGPRVLGYTEMLCVLVTLATSDTGVTNPRPEHHWQAGQN